jgi:glucokinase
MAGPRDDETGNVEGTNFDWPTFSPQEATDRYPGTAVDTVNDMVATAAGTLEEPLISLETLKPGTLKDSGAKLIMALSTGVGAAGAVWDKRHGHYTYVASEGGHIGFQPKAEAEHQYLRFLQQKYPGHVSAEQALSGKHGIDNLINHALDEHEVPHLAAAIAQAREHQRPIGMVLREYALEGSGADRAAAQAILETLGAMVGSTIRDLTLAFKASGGVYLTGSVALGLGDLLAKHTPMNQRFVHDGAVHAAWLEHVPIYLVTDPNVAVLGALALAKR